MRHAPLTARSDALLSDGGRSDREFRAFVHGLLAFSSRLEAIRSGFASYLELTGIQYTVMISIAHLEGEQTVEVNTIARHLHLSGAFVTIETGKLAEMGLIEKRPNPDDRRRVMMSVTNKGRERLAALAPIQQQVNDALFECIEPGGLEQHLQLVEALVESGDRANSLLSYLVGGGGHRRRA